MYLTLFEGIKKTRVHIFYETLQLKIGVAWIAKANESENSKILPTYYV